MEMLLVLTNEITIRGGDARTPQARYDSSIFAGILHEKNSNHTEWPLPAPFKCVDVSIERAGGTVPTWIFSITCTS